MDFEWAPGVQQFREEVRAWLKEELAPERVAKYRDAEESGWSLEFTKEFRRRLAKKGDSGISWPKEYGGSGKGMAYQAVLTTEIVYAGAPQATIATNIVGPALMHVGTEQQKREFLPRIAAGEIEFCLGYSEPGAGSDLAGLQTMAVEKGDEFVVNGQKIFTSGAHNADYCWLAARTDPNAPKHSGVSLFIVDMKTPGIQVRILWTIAGWKHDEVFFDDVHVPRKNLVGEKDKGWQAVSTALNVERTGLMFYGRIQRRFDELTEYCKTHEHNGKPLSKDARVRGYLAQMYIDLSVGYRLTKRVMASHDRGHVPDLETSVNRLWVGQLSHLVSRQGTMIMGLYGGLMPGSPYAPVDGMLSHEYLECIPNTISGGAAEIQRNIIAQRGLKMPRA